MTHPLFLSILRCILYNWGDNLGILWPSTLSCNITWKLVLFRVRTKKGAALRMRARVRWEPSVTSKFKEQSPSTCLPSKKNQLHFTFINKWMWFIWEERRCLMCKVLKVMNLTCKVPSSIETKKLLKLRRSVHTLENILQVLHNWVVDELNYQLFTLVTYPVKPYTSTSHYIGND